MPPALDMSHAQAERAKFEVPLEAQESTSSDREWVVWNREEMVSSQRVFH